LRDENNKEAEKSKTTLIQNISRPPLSLLENLFAGKFRKSGGGEDNSNSAAKSK
jgi:hypothetical protein